MRDRLPSSFQEDVLERCTYRSWSELEMDFALSFRDQDKQDGGVEKWDDADRLYFKYKGW